MNAATQKKRNCRAVMLICPRVGCRATFAGSTICYRAVTCCAWCRRASRQRCRTPTATALQDADLANGSVAVRFAAPRASLFSGVCRHVCPPLIVAEPAWRLQCHGRAAQRWRSRGCAVARVTVLFIWRGDIARAAMMAVMAFSMIQPLRLQQRRARRRLYALVRYGARMPRIWRNAITRLSPTALQAGSNCCYMRSSAQVGWWRL